MEWHVSKRKHGTKSLYKLVCDNHLSPKLGKARVKNITHADIAKLHRKMQDSHIPEGASVAA